MVIIADYFSSAYHKDSIVKELRLDRMCSPNVAVTAKTTNIKLFCVYWF